MKKSVQALGVLLQGILISAKFLTGSVLVSATAIAHANNPFSQPLNIKDGEIAAVWSQVRGHQHDSDNAAGVDPAAYSPPDVELRFIIQGNDNTDTTSCTHNKHIFVKKSETDAWSAAGASVQAVERARDVKSYKVDSSQFNITLCTLTLDPAWYQVALSSSAANADIIKVWRQASSGTELEASVMGPASIGSRSDGALYMLTMGDTGCRGQDSGGQRMKQNCSEWTFPDLNKKAASGNAGPRPDITLHVGDYRYHLENQMSGAQDSFTTWFREFIEPAQPLFQVSVWAFGRGNHEGCDSGKNSRWYGNAFRYFFADSDAVTSAQRCGNLLPTRYFDIGPKHGANTKANHRIVLVDNSNPRTSFNNPGNSVEKGYLAAIEVTGSIDNTGASVPYVDSTHWFSHIPELALLSYCRGQCDGDNKKARDGLIKALKSTQWNICLGNASGGCSPSVLFRGHQHFFERITVPDSSDSWVWPQTYIVGHGGTKKDSIKGRFEGQCTSAVTLSCDAPGLCDATVDKGSSIKPPSFKATVYGTESHGYVLWKRDATIAGDKKTYPTGWEPAFVWADGKRTPPMTGNHSCRF